MKKDLVISILIVVLVVILAVGIMSFKSRDISVDEDITKCIGEKATLYTQLGCHACETQENILGENKENINIVDCFYEREKCGDIRVTPSWKIDGKILEGVRSIDELKNLTGC